MRPVPTAATGVGEAILAALRERLPTTVAAAVLRSALSRAGLSPRELERRGFDRGLLAQLSRSMRSHTADPATRRDCEQALERLLDAPSPRASEPSAIEIVQENHIVTARNRARVLAGELGFDRTTCIKIATAVSELARNMWRYAGGGLMRIELVSTPRRALRIVAEDQGPGIADLAHVLSGEYVSKTGMGLGLLACKRLMDEFEVETGERGTRVSACKYVRS